MINKIDYKRKKLDLDKIEEANSKDEISNIASVRDNDESTGRRSLIKIMMEKISKYDLKSWK